MTPTQDPLPSSTEEKESSQGATETGDDSSGQSEKAPTDPSGDGTAAAGGESGITGKGAEPMQGQSGGSDGLKEGDGTDPNSSGKTPDGADPGPVE